MNCSELVFEFSANGKAANTTVTSRIGDDIIDVDKGDVTRASFRERIIGRICDVRTGINRNDADNVLMAAAADHAKRQIITKGPADEPDGQTLLLKMPQHVRDERG